MDFNQLATLAGVMVGVGSGFAVPFGVWMAKMWGKSQILDVQMKAIRSKLRHVESNQNRNHRLLVEQVGTLNDRLNEHAEALSGFRERMSSVEREIEELQHRN